MLIIGRRERERSAKALREAKDSFLKNRAPRNEMYLDPHYGLSGEADKSAEQVREEFGPSRT